MMLASIESFLGSLWFALMCLAIGWIAGHLRLIDLIKKK